MPISTPVAVAPLVRPLGICLDLPHHTVKALSLLLVVCVENRCAVMLPHRSVGLSDLMK